jgi:hypothetical protein
MVTKTKQPGPFKQTWHGVSIAGGPLACPAAEGLRHKRFLSDEAPSLPVPECSSPWRCKCIYRHHSDRRATLRRRETDRSRSPSPRVGKERREKLGKRGRRTGDQYIVAMRTHYLIAHGDHLAFEAEVVRYGLSPSDFALEIHRVPGKLLPRHSRAATFAVTVENAKNGRCASYLGGPGRSWIAGFVEDLITGTFGQP